MWLTWEPVKSVDWSHSKGRKCEAFVLIQTLEVMTVCWVQYSRWPLDGSIHSVQPWTQPTCYMRISVSHLGFMHVTCYSCYSYILSMPQNHRTTAGINIASYGSSDWCVIFFFLPIRCLLDKIHKIKTTQFSTLTDLALIPQNDQWQKIKLFQNRPCYLTAYNRGPLAFHWLQQRIVEAKIFALFSLQ